ncbi:MAG: hypothetical protein LBV00_12360 [Propionibacteriaceae bacterium]|nr:hypothetical protein [Propionibacteriaceae bacterium]
MTHPASVISVVALESRCGATARNLASILSRMRQAADAGATLVAFPEASLTGYCVDHAAQIGLRLNDPAIDEAREAARDLRLTALIGLVERSEDALFISQVACDAQGALHVFRKTHLGRREHAVFSPGDGLTVGEGRPCLGVGICYDMHFPEVASTLRARGAELIVSPHASPVKAGQRDEVWARYMPTRAYDNRVYVACCNASGTNGCGTVFASGVAVYDPDGTLVSGDFCAEETMVTAELTPRTYAGGKDFPQYRRPELYH